MGARNRIDARVIRLGPGSLRLIKLLVATCAVFVVQAGHCAGSVEDLEQAFREQGLKMPDESPAYLKKNNPEKLQYVAGSLICPMRQDTIERVTKSVLTRARIDGRRVRKEPKPGDIYLDVQLVCDPITERVSVYWIEVRFRKNIAGIGNVILPGGNSWAGIYEQGGVEATLAEFIGMTIEPYILANFAD